MAKTISLIHVYENKQDYMGYKGESSYKGLLDRRIPLDIYTDAFFIISLYTLDPDIIINNIEVSAQTKVSNLLEPEFLELLRLCYWINICRKIIDKESFETKFNEFKEFIGFKNEKEFRQELKNKFVTSGSILQDDNIPYDARKEHAGKLVKELEQFRSKISSFLSEFILATLIQGQGFNVRFIPVSNIKSCDFTLNSYNTEVKTFLDSYEEGIKIESSLIKEIEGTLKRTKAVNDINDALSKKADMIFMFLGFSSLAMGFAKYTYKKSMSFPLLKALNESISLCNKNRVEGVIKNVPVVVFTTLIDADRDCSYKIFCLTIPYPVKINNMNQIEAHDEKLSIEFEL